MIKTRLAPIALVIAWSSGFVGAELGTRAAPATTVLAWRYLVAAAALLAICQWRRARPRRAELGRQVALGVLIQAAYLGLTVGGVGLGSSAGTAALIASMQPLVVVGLAALTLAERPRRAELLGLGLGLVGVAVVVGGDVGAGGAPWWVYLLPLGGMLALSVGTLLDQRWRSGESLLAALAVQTGVAGVVMWGVALATGTAAPAPSGSFWVAVVWTALLSSLGGYGAYLYVVRAQGATRASAWLYLTPPTTMVWTAVMFGDSVPALGMVGVAVTAIGVAVFMRRRTPKEAVVGEPLRISPADSRPSRRT